MYFITKEGLEKYNQTIYYKITDIFDSLPLAAIIDKKYFAVHAGISPSLKTLEDIRQLDRYR